MDKKKGWDRNHEMTMAESLKKKKNSTFLITNQVRR
jgi:hypothetical protein